MNLRRCFHELKSVASAVLAISCASLITPSAMWAQAPTTLVGTASMPQTAVITITTPGIAASISVVTQGSQTLDYALASPNGGTCAALATYTAGQTCTVQYTFTPGLPFTRYGAITVSDALGNVLGNLFLTGVGTGPQVSFPLSAASASSALGSGFNTPIGVAVDASGNIYVADSANNAVKEIRASDNTVLTLGTGFAAPSAVAIDGAGNIYVADTGNNMIKEIVAVNGAIPLVPTILTLGTGFSGPQGVAVDGSGNVYVADTLNSLVKEIVAVNGVIPATTPTINTVGTGFSAPVSVAVDASGNVYVADSAKTSIVEIQAVGGAVVNLGTGLASPLGVAVDGIGNVYVDDLGNKLVKKLIAVGGAVPTTSATVVSLGSGFTSPAGVAVDGNGNVFVGDKAATTIAKLSAQTPQSLTFASTAIGATSTDSPQTATVANIGNAALSFPIPTPPGFNPSASPSFGYAGTCPQVASTASSAGSLAAGASCTYTVSFTPVTAGTPAGAITLSDNNLNVASTQGIPVSGTSTPGTPSVTVSSPSVTVGDTSVSLQAMVVYAGVPPTGAFTFTVGSGSAVTAACTGTASPLTCSVTYNPSSLNANSYTITGALAADGNYNTASGTGTLTVNQATPTVTLGTSGSPSVVDNSVTFTASITPTSGIVPTGKVGFTTTLNGTTTSIPNCTAVSISSNKAICTTSALQAGSNSIGASLASDTNFVAATATAITQSVSQANVTLTTTSSQSGGSTVDQQVIFTATLTGTQSFTITPAGTVGFTANGVTIPGCSAVSVIAASHTASCTASALVSPSDVIVATYSGDANFNNTTANSFTQVVSKSAPTNTISSNVPSSVVNQSVTFTATVTPAGATSSGVTPTGSITFTSGAAAPGGTQLCSPVVVTAGSSGTGTASCTTSFSAVSSGTNIFAVYSGDSNFTAGNAPSQSEVVNKGGTFILSSSVITNPSSPTVNQPGVTLGATVSATFTGSALPGGTVTFTDASGGITPASCVSTLSGGTVPACSVTFTTTGPHTITAAYSGDANFSSSQISNSINVGSAGSVTLNVTTSSAAVTENQTATYSAAFSPTQTGPTYPVGTVQYYDGSTALTGTGCNAAVSATGTISNCTEVLATAGTHVISAIFTTQNSNFTNITSGNLAESVSQNSTKTTLTAPSTVSTVDQVVTFAATVTPTTLTPAATGTTAPSGSILFNYTLSGVTTTICSGAVSTTAGVSSATCTAAFPSATTYPITAVYSGDANFTTSSSTPYAQVVGKAGTTLGLVSGSTLASPASPAVNQTGAYLIQLSLNGGISDTGLTLPTGSVTFKDAATSTITCSAPISASGQASCSLAELTAGSHNIVITYVGDANFGTSTTTLPITIAQSGTSIAAASISTNPSSPTVDQTGVVLNASLAPTFSGTALPGGTLIFSDAATGITTSTCTTTVTAGVVAPCTHVFTTAGTHTITAAYQGDANFSAISNSTTITVGTAGSVTLILPPTSAVTVNQQATYTAAFSPTQTGPTYPVGTVQFYDGSTALTNCLYTLTDASAGVVPACTETMTSAGTHVISAVFTTSNSNFTNITSGNLPQLVNQNTTKPTLTAPTAPSTVDQVINFAATLTPTALSPAATGTTAPTGVITFYATNASNVTTALCGGNVSTAAGVTSASCSSPLVAAGSYGITATYGGDSNFLTSTSTTYNQVVGKTAVTVGLSGSNLASPVSPAVNQSALYTVQITPSLSDTGLTLPTGSVTFKDAVTGTITCAAPVSASGQASCSLAELTAGAHSIVVTYAGDTNFSTNTNTLPVTIAQSGTAITAASISTNPSSPMVDQAGVVLNATIAPTYSGSALPGGTLIFSDAATGFTTTTCSTTVTAGVVAPCTHVFTTAGTHTITAAYQGDSNFSAISTSTTITVGTAGSVTLTLPPTPAVTVNQQSTYTAVFSPAQTGPTYPVGKVQFYDGSTALANCLYTLTAASAGVVPTCTETLTSAGTHVISAVFSTSDTNFTNITSGNLPQIVNQNATKTVLTAPTAPSSVDQLVTFSASVSAATLAPAATGTTAPSGTITFNYTLNGVTTAICGGTVSTTANVSTASCVAPFPAATTYGITAVYNADSNFISSTSTTYNQVVNKTSTAVGLAGASVASPASPVANQLTPYTVLITPAISDTGLTLPTGSVTFQDANVPSATCTAGLVSLTGQATCSFTDSNTAAIVNGVHSIVATYTGDNNFSGSVQTFSITIGVASPTIAITPSALTPTVNLSGFSFNATIAVPAGSTGLPSGSVLFTDTATGTATTTCTSSVALGIVTPCAHTFASAGVHTITASYSGDASFGATSSTGTVNVSKATPGITLSSTFPTSVGTQSVTFTATVTPSPSPIAVTTGTPSGTITFTSSPTSVVGACTPVAVSSNGTEVATCTVTFPATVAGNFAVTASYAGDSNYNAVTTSIVQSVQTFTASLTPVAITLGQGTSTNASDPYFTTAVTYSITSLNQFADITSTTCTTSSANLACVAPVPSLISGTAPAPVIITASPTIAPGVYTVTVTTTDNAPNHTSLSLTSTTAVTVIGRSYPSGQTTVPYSVPTLGTVSIPFTIPSTLAGSNYSCAQNVANLTNSTTGTYTQTGDTLKNLNLACTITGSSTAYTVTIAAGSTLASLKSGPTTTSNHVYEIVSAGLFAPFFLLLGFSDRTKRTRKVMLRYMAICLLAVGAMYTTGCSNGFALGNKSTYAVGGQYLIEITNAQGVPVAEIPLLVTGNGSGI